MKRPRIIHIVWPLLLTAVVTIGAGVLFEYRPVSVGKSVPFSGLDYTNVPTNIPVGGATESVNFVYDKANALHVRKGLQQWNSITNVEPFEFFCDFTGGGGQSWYVASNEDTTWIANSNQTNWTMYAYPGDGIDTGSVDTYEDDPYIHGNGLYKWRRQIRNDAGLTITVDDTMDVTSIWCVCDSLIRITQGASSDLSDVDYEISLRQFMIRDAARANDVLYLATTEGLYRWNGYSLDSLGAEQTYHSWSYTSAHRGAFTIRFDGCSYNGTGDEPDDDWPIGKWAVFSSCCLAKDVSTIKDNIRGQPYAQLFSIWYFSSGVGQITTTYAPGFHDRLSDWVAYPGGGGTLLVFEAGDLYADSVSFTADSIVVDSIEISGRYALYSEIWPTYPYSLAWDDTRFESGDWRFAVDGYPYQLIGIGRVDTIGAESCHGFYVQNCVTKQKLTNIDVVGTRVMRSIESGPNNYKLLCVYLDRLFYVKEEEPNTIYYSPVFMPDSVDQYQSVSLDISRGDEIEALAGLYGNLYIFTRNSIFQMSGDPEASSTSLIELFSGAGVSAPKTFIKVENSYFLAHRTGLYLFDGGQPVSLGGLADALVRDSIDWALAYEQMCAGYYDKQIWVTYPVVGSGGLRTINYNMDTKRWGNHDFEASAYYRIDNTDDSNRFVICLADSGSACIYKGNTDGDIAIDAEYETGWSGFGSDAVKEIIGYYATYQKSPACTLVVEISRNDTIQLVDTLGIDSTTQIFKDKRRSFDVADAAGRLLKLGIKLLSAAGDTWIGDVTLQVVEKEEKRYDR